MVNYYIDYAHGADTPVATNAGWGQKSVARTIDSSADTTHFVDAALTGANDYINGGFFYNRTRSLGAYVTDFDAATDTVTLGGAIAGMAAGDDYYFIFAWKTLSKAATTLAVGDICYVRAGTSENLAAHVDFTNDGNSTLFITIKGMGTGSATLETTDGTATEAWHEASTARPVISGNNAAYGVRINGDYYWAFYNLDIGGSNGYDCMMVSSGVYMYIENCVFRDQGSSSFNNFYVVSTNVDIVDCEIKNGSQNNILTLYAIVNIINCTIDSGALTSNYGIVNSGSLVFCDGCLFGQSSALTTSDLYMNAMMGRFYCRNCKFSTTPIATIVTGELWDFAVLSEDHNQVYGDFAAQNKGGYVTRSTAVTRTGGASSSLLWIPLTTVGGINLYTILQKFPEPLFKVWCPAEETTITVYVRAYGTWSTYPTAANLFLRAEYVTDDTTEAITRATVDSTEVLADTTTWVGLSCTINPHVASFVNLTIHTMIYQDASTGVYVDIKPVIS